MPRTCLTFAFLLAACGPDYDLYEAEPDCFSTITLWVEPHPDMPAEAAREACERWRPEGILCRLVDDPDAAAVRITADESLCVVNDNGRYSLGHAAGWGEFVLMISCLREFHGDPIDDDVYQAVVAHEMGHQLGIAGHYPEEDCASSKKIHPIEGPICGPGLMNPTVRPDLHGITVPDHLAFEIRNRDPDNSVLPESAVCAQNTSK